MSQVAESYARWLADYYLLATILLALSLIGIALQKQPVRRLAVAKSTLVSLILLAVLCAIPGWSVVHLLTEERPQSVAEFHDEVLAKPVIRAERVRPMVSNAPPIVHEDAAVPATPESRPEPLFNFHLPWPALFATTHLAGSTCIILWLVFGWIASARLRRTARPAPTDLAAVFNQVFGQTVTSTQRPQLLTHERIDVAVALGAWRPTILLPGRWIRNESPDHLRTVLAHESTHIINHDLRWVALTRMLFISLWANPLFWITRRWLRRDQEALADAAAAELTSRQRYAEQLVAWARDARSRPALHLSSAVGLWEGPSQLRQRIAILLDEQMTVLRNCSRRWRLAAITIAIVVAMVLSMVTLQPPERAEANAPKPAEPNSEALTEIFGIPYQQPMENVQKTTAAIPASAWGNPVNGLRAAIVLESPPVDKFNNLNYDFVVENISDHDIRFSASIHGVLGFNSIEIIGADGKPLPRQPANITTMYADPPRLLRFLLKPHERMPIAPLSAQLVRLDRDGQPVEPQRDFSTDFFKVNPGRYFVSVTADFGPSMESVDPVTKIRTVLSPKPGEWTGKLQTGTVKLALFENANAKKQTGNLGARLEPNTIIGRAVDEKGQPIVGAEALLFRINRIDASRKLQAKTATDANGKYQFENVIDVAKEFPDGKLRPFNPLEEQFVQVFVRAPGRVAGMRMDLRQQIALAGDIFDMTLKPAATLTGRVTGPDGKPVGGALVAVGGSGFDSWVEVASTRTKADGTYVISDAEPYGLEEYRKKAAQLNRQKEALRNSKENTYAMFVMPPMLTVTHPDFATKKAIYEKIPGTLDVKLDPGAIVEGRAIYGDSAKPAAGVIVHLSTSPPKDAKPGEDYLTLNPVAKDTRTNADGKYRFASLPAGNYDLSAEARDWVNVGVDAFAAASGKTSTAPNLVLTKGGVISIRLIDGKTGKPIALKPGTRADIAAHYFPFPKGFSRPSWTPNASANSAGRFELHAPPGKRAVMVNQVVEDDELKWIPKASGEFKPTVVDVVDGKVVEADLPVVDRATAAPLPQAHLELYPIQPQLLETNDGETTDKKVPKNNAVPAERPKRPAKTKSSSDNAADKADKNDGASSSTPRTAYKNSQAGPPAASEPTRSRDGVHPTSGSVDFSIIVAKYALLRDGQVIQWPEIEEAVAALPNPKQARLKLYFTGGAPQWAQDAMHDKVRDLEKRFGCKLVSFGGFGQRAATRYDTIHGQSDQVPNKAWRVDGVVQSVDGKSMVGAEVILCPPPEPSWTFKKVDIILRNGHLRLPFDEILAHSEDDGKFAIYPAPNTKYYLVALHPDGCGIVRSDEFAKSGRIQIQPWAKITGRIKGVQKFKQSLFLVGSIPAADGWPKLEFTQYSEEQKPKQPTPDGQFVFNFVPPNVSGVMYRLIGYDHFPYKEFQVAPGATETIDVEPPTEDDAKKFEQSSKKGLFD